MTWIIKANDDYWCHQEIRGRGMWWWSQSEAMRFATKGAAQRQLRSLGHPRRRIVKLVRRSTSAPPTGPK